MNHWIYSRAPWCTRSPDYLDAAKPAPSYHQAQRIWEVSLRDSFAGTKNSPKSFHKWKNLSDFLKHFRLLPREAFVVSASTADVIPTWTQQQVPLTSHSTSATLQRYKGPWYGWTMLIFTYMLDTHSIHTNKFLKIFTIGCELIVLMYTQLTERVDGNCTKADNEFAPKNFSPMSLKWLNGSWGGKNKDLLFFTVTQQKCRLNTGSICRFQIFWRPLLLFPCIEI